MTTKPTNSDSIPVEVDVDELDLQEWRVTDEARPEMETAALKVRTLGHDLLRRNLLTDDDVTTEQSVEVTAALALAAHLRMNRLPEAIHAHAVLLGLAGRIMRDEGQVIGGDWRDLIEGLADYIGSTLVYEDGRWCYNPRAVLV